MADLIWQKIKPWGNADDTTHWIAGIYKITSYREGEYHAFFIQDHYKNWGDHVSTPPDNGSFGKCWNSIDRAIGACQIHSKKHIPTKVTIKRADEIKTSLIQQEKENNARINPPCPCHIANSIHRSGSYPVNTFEKVF